jgi:hypothetical protein
MSEPYQIFVLLAQSVNQSELVYKTHEILEQLDAYLDENCLLILNDIGNEEFEPEYLETPEQIDKALENLSKWPTHGSISYFMKMLNPTVTYCGEPYTGTVSAIKFSLTQGFFESHEDELKPFFIQLAEKLHLQFHAKRTIMDWGIEYKGFHWKEEIERLKEDKFIGQYDMLDIREPQVMKVV